MKTHTPGPWQTQQSGNSRPIGFADTINIWSKQRKPDGSAVAYDCGAADAKLIAAAPDLLEALQWAVRFIETYARKAAGPATPELNKARAAIAKATT